MNRKEVQDSISKLLSNLEEVQIPLSLIHQYMPEQYTKIKSGIIKNQPRALVKDRIKNVVDDYNYATKCNFKR